MGYGETARLLSFIGGILSSIVGIIYLIWGVISLMLFGWVSLALPLGGVGGIVYGILCLIFGVLTLSVARPYITEGEELKVGAIMCFIFGGISAGAIGGILTIVAGILAILAWSEERKAVVVETPSAAPPPKPEAAAAFCGYCGVQLPLEAAFCPSCGKKVKK